MGASRVVNILIVVVLPAPFGPRKAKISPRATSKLQAPSDSRLAPAAGATHLFFAAYLPQGSWAAEVGPNRALLVNAVEGLEAVGAPLQHVTLITGAKYYGVHLGPSAAPAAETERWCSAVGGAGASASRQSSQRRPIWQSAIQRSAG